MILSTYNIKMITDLLDMLFFINTLRYYGEITVEKSLWKTLNNVENSSCHTLILLDVQPELRCLTANNRGCNKRLKQEIETSSE